MRDEFQNDYERAEHLQRLLVCKATGETVSNDEYFEFRQRFINNPSTKDLLPRFVRTSRDLAQFWQFIKTKYGTYAERRQYIWDAFHPLFDFLEKGGLPPPANQIADTLKAFDAENVHSVWTKALERATNDPEGAITAARTLLEAVCKHLLDELEVAYGSNPDLPELYSLVAKQLNLSPTQHTEKAFKQILGGCSSIVDALGSLRNRIGDAHGHGKGQTRPLTRHATFAVNLAGAMAMFLVETWRAKCPEKRAGIASAPPLVLECIKFITHSRTTDRTINALFYSLGLAVVCADHGVPLFAWKIISDRADENASELFRTFVATYSGEGGKALAEIIQSLPANPNDPASYPAIQEMLQRTPPDNGGSPTPAPAP